MLDIEEITERDTKPDDIRAPGPLPLKTDSVNHPSHYNTGKIEVIEFIEDQRLGYNLGNALKYVCRAGKKDPKTLLEDLRKAAWYVNREIELMSPIPRRPNEMNS